MNDEELIEQAREVRAMAYAPYSGFAVGAAVQADSGEVFCGCNVENLSFGLTMCAERVAIGAAVVAGQRELRTVVVYAETDQPISPCGACRQVMAEFGVKRVLLASPAEVVEYRLDELLPRASTGILNRA